MPLISARIVNLIKADTNVAFADAGQDQSVLCASIIQLEGEILGDDPALHTFEWEQTFGTPVTLINPNTLFPSFVNPQTSDIEFTLYVDRGTPFETSDTVFISRRPASTASSFGPSTLPGVSNAPWQSSMQSISAANLQSTNLVDHEFDVDFKTGAYGYNYPPDHTYSPIYKADDFQRINDNLGGKYWLMRDIDMSELSKPFVPIGARQTRPFFGELQGNGFTISNLTVVGDGTANIGLFAHASQGAVIEGVAVTNANVSGAGATWYDAILVGSAVGPTNANLDGGPLTIRNCYVEGTVDGGSDRAGGLIGYTGTNVSTLIENTYSDATVTGGGTRTGGWVGFFETEITANDNFWNSDKTTAGFGFGGDTPAAGELVARTTAQLQVQSNYTNWDFDTIWQMPELKDNIGPAQLQSDIGNRVANTGASLTTGLPQAATWKPYTEKFRNDRWINSRNGYTGTGITFTKMLGVIIEDQNPVTLGWENRRFIPVEQSSALMSPGRRHRIFVVAAKGAKFRGFRGSQPLKEVYYSVPETIVPKTETEATAFVSGVSRAAHGPGNIGATLTPTINITNPKKITLTVIDTGQLNYGVGNHSAITVPAIRYLNGLVFTALDTVTMIGTGQATNSPTSVSITRNYGASIGN